MISAARELLLMREAISVEAEARVRFDIADSLSPIAGGIFARTCNIVGKFGI